ILVLAHLCQFAGQPHAGEHEKNADDEREPVHQHTVTVSSCASALRSKRLRSPTASCPLPTASTGSGGRLSLPAAGWRRRNGTTRALESDRFALIVAA